MKHGNMRRFLPLLAAVTLLVGLFVAGCTSANKEVVATCGGDPVLREEYSFLAGKLADAGLGEEEIREKSRRPSSRIARFLRRARICWTG